MKAPQYQAGDKVQLNSGEIITIDAVDVKYDDEYTALIYCYNTDSDGCGEYCFAEDVWRKV